MKKLITWALLLATLLTLFAGCKKKEETPDVNYDLEAAMEYIKTVYKNPAEKTARDYQRIAVVPVGDKKFDVKWSVDVDESIVKIGEIKDGMVTIHVNQELTADTPYVLTATITDGKTTLTKEWKHIAPKSTKGDVAGILNDAFALEPGASMDYEVTLTGVITMINTPYDEGYKNITVTMQIEGFEDKLIQCYRLAGEGADKLAITDIITVTGTLTNYNGTVQFAAGCALDAVEKGEGAPEAPSDSKQIVDEAFALEPGAALPYESVTLSGKIVKINTPYDAGYGNITVTIEVEGTTGTKELVCYRLAGEGAESLKMGDIITVSGAIVNYKNSDGTGTVEFNQGCTLDKVVDGGVELPEAPSDPKKIVDAAFQLGKGESLMYKDMVTLTGKIVTINTPWSDDYGNITVTMEVEGTNGKKTIQAYRLSGDGAKDLSLGDEITVKGNLMNYNGTVQFASGCTLEDVKEGTLDLPNRPSSSKEIVDDAFALEPGLSLNYAEGDKVTLTGKIVKIDTPYDDGYGNITVTIQVEGTSGMKELLVYRLKGEGADALKVDDTITVTGTITNYNGTIEYTSGCTLDAVVDGGGTAPVYPAKPSDPKKIVDDAFALEPGATLQYAEGTKVTLTGKIKSIKTPYDSGYKNITVIIEVEGTSGMKDLECYRLKGEGADALKVGDTITVTGSIVNYNGTIEFNSGCTLDAVVDGGGTAPVYPAKPSDSKQIVDDAFALEPGVTLQYAEGTSVTLTGAIKSIDTPYDSGYQNITVTIQVEGTSGMKDLVVFRLKGEGADTLAVGDTITVTGSILNYNGTIEFGSGCTLDAVVKGDDGSGEGEGGEGEEPVLPAKPSDSKEIVDDAFALEPGATLEYAEGTSVTLTGVIKSIKTPYDSTYHNITVIIEVEGTTGMKDLECFRLKGEGADTLAVGDTITVTGKIKNYNGTIEFDAGCTLDAVVKGDDGSGEGGGEEPVLPAKPSDSKEIVDDAFALEPGATLEYAEGTSVTLTGVIKSIKTPYDSGYRNITVIIQVEGTAGLKDLECFRLKGEGADTLAVGDTITVTGKIKNYNGTIEFDAGCTLDAVKTPAQIVEEAYALASGAALEGKYILTGVIKSIDTPYSEQYQNITVTIQVGDLTDKLIQCYRLKGEGADTLAVGDTVTVMGVIKKYNSKVEFDTGCALIAVVKGENETPVAPEDPKEIVDAAFALEQEESLPYSATLTGTVKSIDDPYSEQYRNITITMVVEGTEGEKDLVCYRLKGDGADTLAVGDTITVTGTIKNYGGTIEFISGCTFVPAAE